jgi:hypothetical protein
MQITKGTRSTEIVSRRCSRTEVAGKLAPPKVANLGDGTTKQIAAYNRRRMRVSVRSAVEHSGRPVVVRETSVIPTVNVVVNLAILRMTARLERQCKLQQKQHGQTSRLLIGSEMIRARQQLDVNFAKKFERLAELPLQRRSLSFWRETSYCELGRQAY